MTWRDDWLFVEVPAVVLFVAGAIAVVWIVVASMTNRDSRRYIRRLEETLEGLALLDSRLNRVFGDTYFDEDRRRHIRTLNSEKIRSYAAALRNRKQHEVEMKDLDELLAELEGKAA